MQQTDITFFKSAASFRKWLDRNGMTAKELWVGFYKTGSGKGGLTYSDSVDEALAHGWIDGIRKSVDTESYTIRFTPRLQKSIWSAVNIARVKKLTEAGRMTPQGAKVFNERDPARAGLYSFERAAPTFEPELESLFRANKKAWAFFQGQAPWYRRTATHWVVTAKRDETRARRLAILIRDSAEGRRIAPLTPAAKKS